MMNYRGDKLSWRTAGTGMLNRTILYNILYALAARNGRDKVLFGGCHPLSQEAFERSLACDAFPE